LVDGSNPFLATKHKLGKALIMPDLADYMTTEEASKKLGFHVKSVARMAREGKLEFIRIGKSILVSRKSIEAYLKATDGMDKRDPRRNVNH
jgi:excisionase family DNA binding protein